MSDCKQELDDLDTAMWELHEAVKAFGESNLGGFIHAHVVEDRSPNGRSVGQWVWLDLKIFSRKKPTTTKSESQAVLSPRTSGKRDATST
jgi:hypothetical protein